MTYMQACKWYECPAIDIFTSMHKQSSEINAMQYTYGIHALPIKSYEYDTLDIEHAWTSKHVITMP